jgi:transmembrane 9 superfamily protein 2/4
VVFFLAGILSMIIVKTLRRDIARYNQEEGVRGFFFLDKNEI